mmetsp:Transcript_14917/g.24294  ORF Transcript_14917/g.24294 Transcript_14917/m.24294 type:complete len:473 (+) Transcript_14917:154-1572(+)
MAASRKLGSVDDGPMGVGDMSGSLASLSSMPRRNELRESKNRRAVQRTLGQALTASGVPQGVSVGTDGLYSGGAGAASGEHFELLDRRASSPEAKYNQRKNGMCSKPFLKYVVFLGIIVLLFIIDRFVLPKVTNPDERVNVRKGDLDQVKSDQSNSVKKIGKVGAELEKALNQIKELKKALNVQDEKMKTINASIDVRLKKMHRYVTEAVDGRGNSYDTSAVHIGVLENMENFGPQRWVYPCNWTGCRADPQDMTMKHLVGGILPDKRRKKDKDLIRIGHIGSCSKTSVLDSVATKLKGRIKYVFFRDKKESQLWCSHNNKHISDKHFQEKYGNDAVTIQEYENFELTGYEDKYFDVVFIDINPAIYANETRSEIHKWIEKWFLKIRNDGFLVGHGYGVKREDGNNSKQHISVSWLGEDYEFSYNELAKTKILVDQVFQKVKDKSSGQVMLAGDTVWYLMKRKVSISDVFSG